MQIKPWQPLRPGNAIAIIAPGFGIDPTIINPLKQHLSQWELQAIVPDDLLGEDLLCANTDKRRFEQLAWALTDEKIKAIWAVRGGYGAAKLIPYLAKSMPPAQPKLLLGFSDVTALHLYLQQQWGWASLHGPVARQWPLGTVAESSLLKIKKIILGGQQPVTFSKLQPLNIAAQRNQKIIGPIIGGNLCVITTSLGTAWQINAKDKILLLEEVNEPAYKIDRMLCQLQQAHIFDDIAALLLGDFSTDMQAKSNTLIESVLQRFATSIDFPVLRIPHIGHGKINDPVPFGIPSTLTLTQIGPASLQCELTTH